MKLRMMMTTVVSAVLLFSITGSLFAANGDLIVNGNLGVGTATPQGKAEVNGNMVVDGDTTVKGNTTTNGNTIVDGNLGVGTATPAKKLDVVGDVNISGTIRGATYGFGGMYSSSCYWACACNSPNPFTGGCSCPSGFTAQSIPTSSAFGALVISVCYK